MSLQLAHCGAERRNGTSRRDKYPRLLYLLAWRGRRRQGRRTEDQINSYVDHYEKRFLFITLGVLLLSCTDAAFTLQLLKLGAYEANPLMSGLLDISINSFVAAKIGLTAVCMIFLVAHKNFHFKGISVSHVLHGFFFMYLLLISYEIALFSFLHSA
ncbi:MAG: hypothetical protein GXP10_07330 [Gammaproteobacteria bacterium]|nr:hypothetical protein [Gammaproteobacteria bacterium]